jgi:SAM-dependent methyltransferase
MKEYKHPERRTGEEVYNFQLIRWLIARGYIPKDRGIKILDLGSGKGHFFFALKKLGYSNVFACDKFPMFDECKKEDIVKGLSYKKESFDLIISRDIAEHVRESEKFFDEQNKILKNGGRIIVMTPNAEKMSFGGFYDDYTHVMPYTRKSLGEALIMHGFKDVRIKRLRAVPGLWKYTIRAFDFLFSGKKNNLLGIGIKNE